MGLRSASCCIHNPAPTTSSPPNQRLFSSYSVVPPKNYDRVAPLRYQAFGRLNSPKLSLVPCLKGRIKEYLLPSLGRGFVVRASTFNQDGKSDFQEIANACVDGVEPFRGKAGSISFIGLTHQLVEEGKLVSAPFNESAGSLFWVWAPVALILSLVLPQFFLAFPIDGLLNNEAVAEIITTISSEVIFYIGLALFLYIAESTQKPYLQYSPKRWGLITGLKGCISSAFFTTGIKLVAPLFAAYLTWPVLGLPALVSVAPFLSGCVAQYAFEKYLHKRGSSCWPVVPIIFEIYRLYQLTKAVHFIEKLMFAMKGVPVTPQVLERSGALVAIIVTSQGLGMVCLWSLLTFLQRLFPFRPLAESY